MTNPEVSSGVEVMAKLGDEIKRVFADNNDMIKKHAVKSWKYYVTNLSPLYKFIPNADQPNASILTKLNTYESKIKAYDSKYVSTAVNITAPSNKPTGMIIPNKYPKWSKVLLAICVAITIIMLLIILYIEFIY